MTTYQENDIVWEDPPKQTKGRASTVWADRLAPLREHPGRWANLGAGFTAGDASRINRGILGGARPGEFEATGRHRVNGRVTLFVRYIGGES